jgi:hypothetical protein
MQTTALEDRKAAFLILQLAEQGRMHETIAQMLAANYNAGGDDLATLAEDLSIILGRVVELLDTTGTIWPGLLPNVSGINPPEFEILQGSQIRTKDQALKLVDNLAEMYDTDGEVNGGDLVEFVARFLSGDKPIVDPHPEKEMFDATVLVVNTTYFEDAMVVCSTNANQRLYFYKEKFYNNLSNPDGDELRAGNIIEVYSDDLLPFEVTWSLV